METRRSFVSGLLSCVLLVGASVSLAACGGGGGSPGGANGALVHLTTTSVVSGVTGLAYTQVFEATFPHGPGLFFVSAGTLPPGLVLDKPTGALSGYPRQPGSFHFELAARDGSDPAIPSGRDANFSEDRRKFTLDVSRGAPNILPQILPAAQYRAAYGYQLDVAGGTPPYTFAKTGGVLPAGVSVSPTGFVGSFPTERQPSPYLFDVTVTDATGLTDTESLSLQVVVLPLVISTASALPDAAAGFPYTQVMTLASSGGGAPYTWTALPPTGSEVTLASIGLTLSSNGELSAPIGVPSAGSWSFSLQVTDEASQVATRQFTLKANPGPVLSSLSPNRSSTPGPYTATGLNFQPGATLIFKPGAGQVVVTPTFLNATTLSFPGPVATPGSGAGSVDVMVKNPDGGAYTKSTAFVFPAATLTIGAKGFVPSTLSSTGLDAADVDGDGRADLVHCGAGSYQATPSGNLSSSGGGGLVYLRNLGTTPPTFSSTTMSSGSFTDVKFADLNADGRLDIIGLGQASIQVWLNGTGGNPLGTFSAAPIVSALYNAGTSIYWPSEMAIGRLNADSIPDVVYGAVYYNSGGYAAGRCFSMYGSGTGTFTALDAALSTIQASNQTNYCMGIHVVACPDLDGDGRSEVLAGTGMGYYNGTYPLVYNVPSFAGTFGAWTQKGTIIASPQYPGIQGLAIGDFLGDGTTQAIVSATGATNYSNTSSVYLLSGNTLTSTTTLTYPGAKTKSVCALDLDFDLKMDWAITTDPSTIVVYRGSTQGIVATLNAATGLPTISSPKTGRVVGGDIDGDGKPDLIATCSYWAGEGMASWQNGTYYGLNLNGDGGQLGLVYYLNASN